VSFEHVGAAYTFDRPLSFYQWGFLLKIRALDAAGNADPTPAVVDLRIFARTNPYIFYTVAGVAALALLYLLKVLLGSLVGRTRRRAPVPSTAASFGLKEETDTPEKKDMFSTSSSSSSMSSFKFDDDDDLDDLFKKK